MPTSPDTFASLRRRRLACAAVGLVTLAVFIPCLFNDFVDYDDATNFRDNFNYRGLGPAELKWMFTTFHLGPYQPLSWMTLGLDYLLWHMKPAGYHFTNILLHALAAALFTGVAARLCALAGARIPSRTNTDASRPPDGCPTPSRSAGWGTDADATRPPNAATVTPIAFGLLAGLLWALHPLRVEAVAWITERREVLCGVLTLLTLTLHLDRRPRWVVALAALLALLAKPTAVVIPVMLVMIDAYRDRPARLADFFAGAWRAVLRHSVIVFFSFVFCCVAIYGQHVSKAVSSTNQIAYVERIALYSRGMGFYVYKTLIPVALGPLYEIPTSHSGIVSWGAVSGVALLAAAAAAIRFRRPAPFALPLLITYFAMVAPVGGLVQVGTQLAADRYTYQPGWALSLAAAAAIAALAQAVASRRPSTDDARVPNPKSKIQNPKSPRSPIAVYAATALIAAALIPPTIFQQFAWRDPETLWTHHIRWNPETSASYYNLGLYLVNRDSNAEADRRAEPLFRKALALRPINDNASRALGNVLKRRGRIAEALQVYEDGLRWSPKFPALIYESGSLLWDLGRRDEAIARLRLLSQYEPRIADTHVVLARALAAAGRMPEAVAQYERASEVDPSAPTAPLELAWLLATYPDARYRDGPRALRLAERARQLAQAMIARGGSVITKNIEGRVLRTLAAAHAENGDFARALSVLDEARNKGLGQFDELGERFRQKLPMRELPRAH